MRAFLSVEPAGTIASFEQVGIPMATELVGGIVFYPPQKPRHVNLQTRKRRPLPHGKSRRSLIYAYRLYIASQRSAPTGTRTQNTRILSPLSLPIGLWGRTPHSSGHKHLLFHENAPEPKQKHISNGSPRSATAITTQKHWWAAKLDSSQALRHTMGGAKD